MRLRLFKAVFLVSLAVLSGCRGLGQTPPPSPFNPESLATANALTAQAPPPGLETLTLTAVDVNLDDLQGYRYTLELRFEGVFDADLSPASGVVRAEVWWDGDSPARRVVLEASGNALAADTRDLEAVRLADDYFLVENRRCQLTLDDRASLVANLDAGSLIGGATEAPYSSVQATLNGVHAYRFDVTESTAYLPFVVKADDSTVELSGEVWYAPDSAISVRYYANAEVNNVRLLEGEDPVSGRLFIRYDVFDLNVVPNISIPFGC